MLWQKTFLDLFPVPEFLLLSTVGVAVTDIDTKFVQLRREIFGDGFKLMSSSRMSNPTGAVESGLISQPDELAGVLKILFSRYNVRYAHAVLPEEKTYLFTTTIGSVPPEGLKDAAAFIIEENVPVTLTDSVFDFEIIKVSEDTGDIKLAVSVVPKNVVDAYIKFFESAGVTPVSFDLESRAMARAVIRPEDKRSHLIINLSLKKTGFYIVEDGVVQFSTTPAYGVGQDQSYSSLNDLKTEMRKVMTFWNAHTDPLHPSSGEAGQSGKPEGQIEKIILCGSGASSGDFVEKLMGGGEVPYELANVWLNMSPSRSRVSEIPTDESLDYASVIGLVLPGRKKLYV